MFNIEYVFPAQHYRLLIGIFYVYHNMYKINHNMYNCANKLVKTAICIKDQTHLSIIVEIMLIFGETSSYLTGVLKIGKYFLKIL